MPQPGAQPREFDEVERAGEEVGRTISGALQDLVVGGKSLDEVLKGLEQRLLALLEQAVFGQPGGLDDLFGGLGGGLGGILSGLILGFQHGGPVTGPGGPRGDRVPALLRV